MPDLLVSISRVQLLRLAAFPQGPIKVVPIVSINDTDGITTERQRSSENNGFDATLTLSATFSNAVMTDRVVVHFVDAISGMSLGHTIISLRRLVRQVAREQYFTIASDTSPISIAGFAKIRFFSQNVGVRATENEMAKAENVLQGSDYETKGPQLARLLQITNPSLLPYVDVILSEGIESVVHKGAGSEAAALFPKDFDTATKPSNAVATMYHAAVDNVTKDDASLKYENELVIAVKCALELPLRRDGTQPNPKIIVTSGSQEAYTDTEQNTCNPTFVDQQSHFCIVGPKESKIQITAVDDIQGEERLIGTAKISCQTITLERNCVRHVPLLSSNGNYAGTVVLDLYTEDFGNNFSAEKELQIKDHNTRLGLLLKRYDVPRLSEMDSLISRNIADLEGLMEDLVEEYGFEPNTAIVSLNILQIQSLRAPNGTPLENSTISVCVGTPPTVTSDSLEYSGGKAVLIDNSKLNVDVSTETDSIVVSVLSCPVGTIIGTVHLSLSNLQRGVHKVRRHPLIGCAGTSEAKIVGFITVDLFSQQVGCSHSLDEICENKYRKRVRRCLELMRPEELHLIDVILGVTYDLEEYCSSLEMEADSLGLEVSSENPKIRVSVLKGRGLPVTSSSVIQTNLQVGKQRLKGPRGSGVNPAFFPCQLDFEVEDEFSDNLSLILTVAPSNEEIGRIVIPVATLWKGSFKKWFKCWKHAYQAQAAEEGEVFLGIETIKCGQDAGEGPSLPLFKELEDIAAEVLITETDDVKECLATSKFDHEGNPIELTIVNEEEVQGKLHTFIITVNSITNIQAPMAPSMNNFYVSALIRDQKSQTKSVGGSAQFVEMRAQTTIDIANPTHADALTLSVIGSEGGKQYNLGECVIDVTRIVKNKHREINVPFVLSPNSPQAQVAGFISLTIFCATWGRKLRSASVSPIPVHLVHRLKDYYVCYRKDRLHLIDFDLLADMDFEKFMSENVRQYGLEPDTYALHMTVVRCNDLDPPSAVVDGGYTVTARLGQEHHQTQSISSSDPVYNDTFTLSASRTDTEGLEIIVSFMGNECGRCQLSLKNLPPNALKRRTVNLVSNAGKKNAKIEGTVTLDFFSENYGYISLPSEEDEASLRERVTVQLSKFAPKDLHRVEYMLGEFVGAEDALMTKLIADYNCLPGDARLALTVKEVRNLCRNGKAVEKGNPFVKIKTHMEKVSTRTLGDVREGYFDETFTFTMATPEKDYLQVSVFNSELGSDYLYGEALISINNLQRGVPRTVTAMIVQKPGTKAATFGGYITLVLRSDDFGCSTPLNVNDDSRWRQRLKNFFIRYCPERLHRIQAISPNDAYMAKLVKDYGPEPNTNELVVAVREARDVVGPRESATVLIQCGIDTLSTRNVYSHGNVIYFNENFSIAVSDPETEELTFIVQRQKDTKEYGRAVVGLRDLSRGTASDLWIHLVANHTTEAAVIIGSLHLQLTAKDFGTAPAKVTQSNKEMRLQNRRRLECIFSNCYPKELHRIEYALSREGEDFVKTLKAKHPRSESSAPLTLRIRELQSCLSGQFAVKVNLEDGKSVLRTNSIRLQPNQCVSLASRECIGTLFTSENSKAVLLFTLVSIRGTTTSELCVSKLATKHCEPDFFNQRTINFFNSAGQCIAKASADIRSVAFKGTASQLNSYIWADVSRDVLSVISKYDPQNLSNLDDIMRSTPNLSLLHEELVQQYVGRPSNTIYLQSCQIEFRGEKNSTWKGQLQLSVEGKPQNQYPRCSSDVIVLLAEKDSHLSALSTSEFASSVTDPFSMSNSNSPLRYPRNRFGEEANNSIRTPKHSQLYSSSSSIRLDLAEIMNASAVLRLMATNSSNESPVLAEAELSLLPYLCSLIAPNTKQEIPLVGKGGSIVAFLRFEVSFPSSQIISAHQFGPTHQSDEQSFLKNKDLILDYYKQTYEHLLKNSSPLLKTLHTNFFNTLMAKGINGCKEIAEKYISQVRED